MQAKGRITRVGEVITEDGITRVRGWGFDCEGTGVSAITLPSEPDGEILYAGYTVSESGRIVAIE